MDFKGITWAGNIYQKFETMCLEVEEVMYEDTAKYVENQVQKVGVSVKKFYEEIVQDLIPTSCVGPVEISPGDVPLKPYTQTDINKNPKSSVLDIHAEFDKKETKYEDISDPTAEESSLNACNDANLLFPASPRVSVESTLSDVCFTKSKKVGVYKRPIGIKRIPKNNHPPKISRALTSLSGDGSSLLSCIAKSNCLEVSNDINIARLKFFVRNDPGGAATENTQIYDASAEPFSSNQNLLAVSVKQEKKDFQSTSPASEEILSDESPRERKDDSEHNSSCHGLPTESIGTDRDEFTKNGSPSQMKSIAGSRTCMVESLGEEVFASSEGKFDIELIETKDVLEPKLELFEPVEKSSLEESCILVELDKLHFVSQATKKHKSYKKKIREALSSKLMSTRIHNQHNFRYQDSGNKKKHTVAVISERNLPCHDSCDSDWELL